MKMNTEAVLTRQPRRFLEKIFELCGECFNFLSLLCFFDVIETMFANYFFFDEYLNIF